MPEVHLSRDDLLLWRNEGSGDRERIVTHLAVCGACRRLAADIERDRPAEAPPVRFDARDFVARGYRARSRPGVRRWTRLTPAAVAAAVVLAAVVVPQLVDRDEPRARVLRGGGTPSLLVRPVGATVGRRDLTFEWKQPSGSADVRLTVFDLDTPGEPVIRRDVSGSRYEPTEEERQLLQPGREYHWMIEYRPEGGAGATSEAGRFVVR